MTVAENSRVMPSANFPRTGTRTRPWRSRFRPSASRKSARASERSRSISPRCAQAGVGARPRTTELDSCRAQRQDLQSSVPIVALLSPEVARAFVGEGDPADPLDRLEAVFYRRDEP